MRADPLWRVLLGLAAFQMATSLPSLSKTWQITGNQTVSTGNISGQHRGMLFAEKQGLVTASLSPWTVVGSSNGIASGIDGVDRWAAAGNVLPDSWIVLKQTALGSNFQLLIQNTEVAGPIGRTIALVSPSTGFSGGGPTTRPTAADEILITDATSTIATTPDVYVSTAVSTDGQCTRSWAFQSGVVIHWMIVDLLQNPIAEATTPWIGYSQNRGAGGGAPGVTSYNDFDISGPIRGKQGATTLDYTPVSTGGPANSAARIGSNVNVNLGVNQLSGDYPMSPVAMCCETAANRGVHGELADLWFGSETAANGDTYPEATFTAPLDRFVQVGDIILPWNNTTPLTGGAAGTRRQGRVINATQTYTAPEGDDTLPILHTAGFGGSTGAELATVSPVYTSGAVWFVSSTNGTDAGGTAGQSREQPLATLAQAQTNATAGDVVVMLASHRETLSSKLTLSKAGLVLLGEGAGTSCPTFSRSADVNMWDITGAGVRIENIRFSSDSTSGFTTDRVLISANSCIVRGCYFASGATDSASPALAVANGVANLTIDGATYFVSSGTSRTVTGYRGLSLKGTTSDLELHDVTFDGGPWGWLSHAVNAAGAVTRLRAKDVDITNGSDIVLASSTTGYIHIRAESGAARIEWP